MSILFTKKYSKENAYNTVRAKEKFPDHIGKTARNELRKYAATWCNNVSIALVAAGILLPTFGVLPRALREIRNDYNSGRYFNFDIPPDIAGLMIVTTFTLYYAIHYRRLSRRALLTLED